MLYVIGILLLLGCVALLLSASRHKPRKVTFYKHHGHVVSVLARNKGKHRDSCLCHQGCVLFEPGTPNNCMVAEELYAFCQKYGITTPVAECRFFYRDSK